MPSAQWKRLLAAGKNVPKETLIVKIFIFTELLLRNGAEEDPNLRVRV
jgi:hypothetical protein